MSSGAGSGSSSGIRNGVPSGNTPDRRRSPILPIFRKSRSNSTSVKPQLCGTSACAPGLDVPFEIAILLLKMLRLEEQPFRPDDAVVGRHRRVRHNLQRMGTLHRSPPRRPPAAVSVRSVAGRGLRRLCRHGARRCALQLPELLLVGARELFAKETDEGGFRVLFHRIRFPGRGPSSAAWPAPTAATAWRSGDRTPPASGPDRTRRASPRRRRACPRAWPAGGRAGRRTHRQRRRPGPDRRRFRFTSRLWSASSTLAENFSGLLSAGRKIVCRMPELFLDALAGLAGRPSGRQTTTRRICPRFCASSGVTGAPCSPAPARTSARSREAAPGGAAAGAASPAGGTVPDGRPPAARRSPEPEPGAM